MRISHTLYTMTETHSADRLARNQPDVQWSMGSGIQEPTVPCRNRTSSALNTSGTRNCRHTTNHFFSRLEAPSRICAAVPRTKFVKVFSTIQYPLRWRESDSMRSKCVSTVDSSGSFWRRNLQFRKGRCNCVLMAQFQAPECLMLPIEHLYHKEDSMRQKERYGDICVPPTLFSSRRRLRYRRLKD